MGAFSLLAEEEIIAPLNSSHSSTTCLWELSLNAIFSLLPVINLLISGLGGTNQVWWPGHFSRSLSLYFSTSINFENCSKAKDAGANILVSGSTIFKENKGDLKKNIELLRNN